MHADQTDSFCSAQSFNEKKKKKQLLRLFCTPSLSLHPNVFNHSAGQCSQGGQGQRDGHLLLTHPVPASPIHSVRIVLPLPFELVPCHCVRVCVRGEPHCYRALLVMSTRP